MEQRPFVLLGAGALAAARQALGGAVDAWCRDWGVARDEVLVECVRAWEGAAQLPAAPSWRAPWRAGERALAIAWPDELPAQVRRLLFGAERQHAPAAGAAHTALAAGEAAWAALLLGLSAAVVPGGGMAAEAMPAAAADWRHASGALLVVVRVGRQACHAVLNGEAVAALVGPAAPDARLAALDYARLLAPVAVRLPVALGEARVDLGSLLRLDIGDVIRLDTPADGALPVRAPGAGAGAPALFGGHLGRRGEDMALELAPHELTKE